MGNVILLTKRKISQSMEWNPPMDVVAETGSRKFEEVICYFAYYDKHNSDGDLVECEVSYNASVHSTMGHALFFLNYSTHPKIMLVAITVPQNHLSVKELLSNVKKSTA